MTPSFPFACMVSISYSGARPPSSRMLPGSTQPAGGDGCGWCFDRHPSLAVHRRRPPAYECSHWWGAGSVGWSRGDREIAEKEKNDYRQERAGHPWERWPAKLVCGHHREEQGRAQWGGGTELEGWRRPAQRDSAVIGGQPKTGDRGGVGRGSPNSLATWEDNWLTLGSGDVCMWP